MSIFSYFPWSNYQFVPCFIRPNNNKSVYNRPKKKDERHRDELIAWIWICNLFVEVVQVNVTWISSDDGDQYSTHVKKSMIITEYLFKRQITNKKTYPDTINFCYFFSTVYTGCITLFYRKCYLNKWFSFKVFVSVWTFKWCRYIVNSCILVLISSHWFLSGLGPCTECLALWTLVHCWRLLGVLYYMRFCILLFFSLSHGHLFHISVFSI